MRADKSKAPCLLGQGRAHFESGYTLVEMLVVIFIISVLAGLITTGVQHARKSADINATKIEIQALAGACESHKTARGDYPPSSLRHPTLGLRVNLINDGNESLLAHLTTRKAGGPFFDDPPDDRLSNLDLDVLTAKDTKTIRDKLDWTRGNNALLEYVDMWGNPFVYLHHRDYRSTKKIQYMDSEGMTVQVEGCMSEKTGTYQDSSTFQIWSYGPNRINENGLGDDVTSWSG